MKTHRILVLTLSTVVSAAGFVSPAQAQTQPGGGFQGNFPNLPAGVLGNFGTRPPRINNAQGGLGVSALGGLGGGVVSPPAVPNTPTQPGAPIFNQPPGGGGSGSNPNLRALLFLHYIQTQGGIGGVGGGNGGQFGGGTQFGQFGSSGANALGQLGGGANTGQFAQFGGMGGVGGKFGASGGFSQIGGGGQFGSRYGL